MNWQPIRTAPKTGESVLVQVRRSVELPINMEGWGRLQFVACNRGDSSEWCFAAPVGMGGFPDAWLWGWMPLPSDIA